jgi:hypothetical protein
MKQSEILTLAAVGIGLYLLNKKPVSGIFGSAKYVALLQLMEEVNSGIKVGKYKLAFKDNKVSLYNNIGKLYFTDINYSQMEYFLKGMLLMIYSKK